MTYYHPYAILHYVPQMCLYNFCLLKLNQENVFYNIFTKYWIEKKHKYWILMFLFYLLNVRKHLNCWFQQLADTIKMFVCLVIKDILCTLLLSTIYSVSVHTELLSKLSESVSNSKCADGKVRIGHLGLMLTRPTKEQRSFQFLFVSFTIFTFM